MVAGISTEVGKTIVSAILTHVFKGDYWKPIQCGDIENSDTTLMKTWLDAHQHSVHAPAYSFSAPLSPHHAARLENTLIQIKTISLPHTTRTLVIEGVGGVLTPLTTTQSSLDLFSSWNCIWVIVSRHYLGSINHTLLTIESLKKKKIPILGIVFNGDPNPDTESAILETSKLPLLGRLLPEPIINQNTFQRYMTQWQPSFATLLP
jgi:dethiobiotin synthetase